MHQYLWRTHAHANSDSYSYRNADAYHNAYRDAHGNSDSNAYLNTYGYTYCNSDGYTNCDTNANSHSERLCFLTRILEKPSRSVAGESIAAWERHLQPATVAIDSGTFSPFEWISFG